MAKKETVIEKIMEDVSGVTGVPVEHAPAASAGEKIIYRCSPGKYDGDFESITVTMRFISKDVGEAHRRAEAVSRLICAPGDRPYGISDELPEFVIREAGGGSGYIGRTGHFFVLAKFSVRRRLPSSVKIGIGQI